MRWKPASAELSQLLESAVMRFPCQKKQIFGYPAYFVNGNMYTGIHHDNIILRLAEPDRLTILGNPDQATPFEPMPGRTMKEYVVLLESVYGNPPLLEKWLTSSFEYVSSLPVKEPKRKPRPRR